jgi:hypothetical protein
MSIGSTVIVTRGAWSVNRLANDFGLLRGKDYDINDQAKLEL